MKKNYIILAILAIAGVIGSLFLIPKNEEVALMNLKDGRFEEAKASYEQQLKQGKNDVSVIGPLVDLKLQDGDVDGAIVLMEKYVKDYPQDIEARVKLGRYYQYAQREDDYLRNLEAMHKANPSLEVTKSLAEMYNYRGDYNKQIEVLREMLKNPKSRNPAAYYDLAALLAGSNRPKEAIDVLQEMQKETPKDFSFDHIQLLVSLLLDQNELNMASEAASDWLSSRKPEPAQIALLASMLQQRNANEQAAKLLAPYEQIATKNEELLSLFVATYVAQGQSEKAYKWLNGLYTEKRLPPSLYGEFLELAFQKHDMKLIHEVVAKMDANQLSESDASQLLLNVMASKDDELLRNVTKKIASGDYLARQPYITLLTALVVRAPDVEQRLTVHEAREPLSIARKIQLGEACARTGYFNCTNRMINDLRAIQNLTETETAGLARLYLYSKRYDEGYQYINTVRQLNPKANLNNTWILFAAATGKDGEVTKWLDANPKATMEMLRDMYYMASDNNRGKTAVLVATRMDSMGSTKDTKNLLAMAQVKAGQFEAALPYLREHRNDSRMMRDTYITALGKGAANNVELKNELIHFVSQQLEAGNQPDKEKQELIYTLINAGAIDPVLPYIEEYALTQGGTWAALYQEQLVKKGDKQKLQSFLLALADKPFVKETDKQAIAFALLDNGYKKEAASLMQAISATSSPDSKNTSLLMYLWGPRPSTAQLDWMLERARQSKKKENVEGWAKRLSDHGGRKQLITLADERQEILSNPKIAAAYVDALGKEDADSLRSKAFKAIEAKRNPDTLRQFARAARFQSDNELALTIYDELLKQKPNDPEALLEAGILSYGNANYDRSEGYLNRYMSNRDRKLTADYQAPYYLGEIAIRNGESVEDAAVYYKQALDAIDTVVPKTVEVQSIAARSQYYAGSPQAGLTAFRKLVAENPANKTLRADYMSLLVDNQQYGEVRKMSELSYAENKSATPNVVARIRANDVSQYVLQPRKRELLIYTRNEAEAVAKKNGLDVVRPAGLQYISTGYDTILLGASGSNVLSVREVNGELEVLSSPAPEELSARQLQQLDVRKELIMARVDIGTGHTRQALNRLHALREENPNNPQVQSYAANAKNILLGASDGLMSVGETNSKPEAMPISEPEELSVKQAKQLELRQELLLARVDLETGNTRQALTRLNALRAENPRDPQVLSYTAHAENVRGNWRQAVTLLDEAKKIAPKNQDVAQLDREIRRNHAQNVKVDGEWRSTGDNEEKIVTTSGFAYVRPFLEIGFMHKYDWVDAKNVRRSSGAIGSYEENRQQFEVYSAYTYDDGDRVKAALYGNDDTLGGGGEYAWLTDFGVTTFEGQYHKPYWEYVEGVLDGATRDRAAIGHSINVRPDFTISGAAGYNRYNVKDDENVASAVAISLSVVKEIWEKRSSSISLGYALDGEYLVDSDKKVDPLGETFRTFPVTSREMHSVNIIGRHDFTKDFYGLAAVGYGYDRLGDHGPTAEGQLNYNVTDQVEAQLRAAHYQGSGAIDGDVDRVGAYLMWKF